MVTLGVVVDFGPPSHTAAVKRWCSLLAGLLGCASGDDPATMPTTFTSANPTESRPDTSSTTDASSGDAESSTNTTTAGATGTTWEGTSTGSADSTPDTDNTSGAGMSEQPEDGMYSACASAVDCIGLTTCLTATDTGGQPIDPFCTAGSCKSPLAQCAPTPGGTAVPICLEVDLGGVMDSVCALDCSQGQACPMGMDCRTLEGASICS